MLVDKVMKFVCDVMMVVHVVNVLLGVGGIRRGRPTMTMTAFSSTTWV